MLCGRRCGRRALALAVVSAAILSGCANPILDTLLDRNAAAPPALPANEVLSLSVVRQEFPMMTRMARTGVDPEAPGTPQATRRSQFSDLTAMVQLTVRSLITQPMRAPSRPSSISSRAFDPRAAL